MISRIKNLVQISEKLEGINKKVEENKSKVEDHSEVLKEYCKQMEGYSQNLKELHTGLSTLKNESTPLLDGITEIQKSMKNELFEMKMIKSDLKGKMISELTESFREEMKKQTSTLDTDVKRFNELKDQLEKMTLQFQGIEEEVSKLKVIAKEIKSADFTLAQHARELTKNDSEKLRLMRENDNLKRLISKERRKR